MYCQQSSFWDILTQKSVESPHSMKHKYSHPSAHWTFSFVVNLKQNMWPNLLQSSRFHRPRTVGQPLLPFYCSNWAEIELFGPGCKMTWSPACVQLCLSKNTRLLRWPFPASLSESSNWFLLFLSAEANKNLHLTLICLNITRNIKNTVKGEILYSKLSFIDPCNVLQIKIHILVYFTALPWYDTRSMPKKENKWCASWYNVYSYNWSCHATLWERSCLEYSEASPHSFNQ